MILDTSGRSLILDPSGRSVILDINGRFVISRSRLQEIQASCICV